MSFPYTTTSPPPTSGALTVVDKANLSQSYAGGGGGGGGAGPNLAVSTLSVNDSGNITLDWNNGGATLNFGYEATNTSSFNIQQGASVQQSRITGPQGSLQFVEQEGSVFGYAPVIASGIEIATGAFPGQASAGLYSGNNTSILYSINQPMLLDAPAGVSISSLSVSSINGAQPGSSGGGPTLGTSSITTSTINFPTSSNSGLFYPADSAVVANDVGISLTPLTGQYGNTGVVGAWGKEVYQGAAGFGEFAAQRYYVTDVTGGKTNQTLIENVGNQIQIQTPSSISLQADTYVTGSLNVSSLSVSSINGSPGFLYVENPISSIGSLPILTSMLMRSGKLQTAQFEVNFQSTATSTTAGYIDMLCSAMAPGNWRWQQTPSAVINSITTGGGGMATGVNVQLSGDPGDLSQDLTLDYRFADSNIPERIRVTLHGPGYA